VLPVGNVSKSLKNGIGRVDGFPKTQRNVWHLILHMLLKYSRQEFVDTVSKVMKSNS
jgi:hypothetical protein